MDNYDKRRFRKLLLRGYTTDSFEKLHEHLKLKFILSWWERQKIILFLYRVVDKSLTERLSLMDYNDYLNTVYWKLFRLVILSRDKYSCTVCRGIESLHVHHLSYKNRGREFKHLSDLTVLCSNCHKAIHGSKSGYGKEAWKALKLTRRR